MAQAKSGDKVTIDYTGKLEDGTVFDSTLEDECNSDECDSDDSGDDCGDDDCGCGGHESGPMELTIGEGELFSQVDKALIDMSPGGVLFRAPVSGIVNDRVIAYLETVGRVEGLITRCTADGFAMTVNATIRRRDKLASQLTWLANRQILNLPEDRRHGRFVPRKPLARLILPNGTNVTCRVGTFEAAVGAQPVDHTKPRAGLVGGAHRVF